MNNKEDSKIEHLSRLPIVARWWCHLCLKIATSLPITPTTATTMKRSNSFLQQPLLSED